MDIVSRWTIAITIILAATLVFNYCEPPIRALLHAQRDIQGSPQVWMVPTPSPAGTLESPAGKIKTLMSLTTVSFSGGQAISFFTPDAQRVLGDKSVHDILNTTPKDLRLFTTRQKSMNASLSIGLKSTLRIPHMHGIYSFATQWVRGLRYGFPRQDDIVEIQAFDTPDRDIKIIVSGNRGTGPGLSPADVNRIIHSLRPSPIPNTISTSATAYE
jgi:hypothetical protein